ncbi:hypothetical protein AGLY_004180 [Aphis glycines]|uniref:Uncharacterized protein n=1 Tax=Aphis glycines TaxID=307491 RepID=A0A6G0TXH5_APHGL|nr:hypothetical protein AGLY_004180 [Aphis glycines]
MDGNCKDPFPRYVTKQQDQQLLTEQLSKLQGEYRLLSLILDHDLHPKDGLHQVLLKLLGEHSYGFANYEKYHPIFLDVKIIILYITYLIIPVNSTTDFFNFSSNLIFQSFIRSLTTISAAIVLPDPVGAPKSTLLSNYIPVTEAWLCGIIRCWNVNGVVKVVPNHRSEVQCNIYCDGNGSTKVIRNCSQWYIISVSGSSIQIQNATDTKEIRTKIS